METQPFLKIIHRTIFILIGKETKENLMLVKGKKQKKRAERISRANCDHDISRGSIRN